MTDTDDRAVSSVLRLYTREVFSDAPGGAENPTPDELAVPLVVRPEDASSAAVVKAMCATVMERFGRIVRKRFQEKGIEAERVRLQVTWWLAARFLPKRPMRALGSHRP
eukprot:scaffold4850_cov213-Pinguiococcus_pyrenoidosus.AAC.25